METERLSSLYSAERTGCNISGCSVGWLMLGAVGVRIIFFLGGDVCPPVCAETHRKLVKRMRMEIILFINLMG